MSTLQPEKLCDILIRKFKFYLTGVGTESKLTGLGEGLGNDFVLFSLFSDSNSGGPSPSDNWNVGTEAAIVISNKRVLSEIKINIEGRFLTQHEIQALTNFYSCPCLLGSRSE